MLRVGEVQDNGGFLDERAPYVERNIVDNGCMLADGVTGRADNVRIRRPYVQVDDGRNDSLRRTAVLPNDSGEQGNDSYQSKAAALAKDARQNGHEDLLCGAGKLRGPG